MEILIERVSGASIKKSRGPLGQILFECPMIQMDVKNRNGRTYPSSLIVPVVESYIETYVKKDRAIGELHHPEESQNNLMNLKNIAIKINSLVRSGKDYIGTASPIVGSPSGDIVQALLENDVVIGTSQRGYGKTDKSTGKVLQFGIITAADVEYSPSAPDAFASILTESHSQLTPDYFKDPSIYESLLECVNKNRIEMAFRMALDNLKTTYNVET